jgi:2-polyprenyl-6-methoxyphenol hydroxylase-like FAD-dependent oxidoreductase
MQHFRRWGISEALRLASPLPPDYPTDIVFATRLFGKTLAIIENGYEGTKRRDIRFPEPAQWAPQYTVEAVLKERANSFPSVSLNFDTELVDFKESDSGISAKLRSSSTGAESVLRAKYLVGADGARSIVRNLIGSQLEGEHALGLHYNVILRIPGLRPDPPHPPAVFYWLLNPDCPAGIARMGDDKWAIAFSLPPGKSDLDDTTITKLVIAAIGKPIDFEILVRDAWAAHRLIADRYSTERVFLVGDACHLLPPSGGFGMNLGIADSVDLGWKLAATLDGWGGTSLLATYQTERKPVHQRTLAEAVANHSVLSEHLLKADLDDDSDSGEALRTAVAEEILASKSRQYKTVGIVLGSRYSDSPLVIDDGSRPPNEHCSDYVPSACPGSLTPHAWLQDGSSLYDHFGQGFTLLLISDQGTSAADLLVKAADACLLPLKFLDLRCEGLYDLFAGSLVLVRPDQHIAWRNSSAEVDAEEVVAKVRGG